MAPSVETPVSGPAPKDLIAWLKTIFGDAFSVSRGYSAGHDGIDLPANIGTPVRALAAGTVSYARDARTQADKGSHGWAIGGGNVVNIDVGGTLTTQYAHLQSFTVREGQYVAKGQVIGYVGNTGGTNRGVPGGPGSTFSGPHLHFGLWDHSAGGSGFGKMINPQKFLEMEAGNSTSTDNPMVKALKRYATNNGIDLNSVMTADQFWEAVSGLPGFTKDSTEAQQVATNYIGRTWNDVIKDAGTGMSGPTNDGWSFLAQLGDQAKWVVIFLAVVLVGIAFILLAGLVTKVKSE